jgi:hypothetical protein
MSNKSFFKSKVAPGVMALGLATTASLLAPNSAQAVALKMVLSGVTTSDGATITGDFQYTQTGIYSAFNIISTPGSIVTTGGSYTSTSLTGAATVLGVANTNTSVSIQSGPTSSSYHFLRMLFNKDLDTMNIGDTANIIPGTTFPVIANSFEVFSQSPENNQLRTLQGGIITAYPIPEPLTILGTGLALGFGGLFKSKSSKKQSVKA